MDYVERVLRIATTIPGALAFQGISSIRTMLARYPFGFPELPSWGKIQTGNSGREKRTDSIPRDSIVHPLWHAARCRNLLLSRL